MITLQWADPALVLNELREEMTIRLYDNPFYNRNTSFKILLSTVIAIVYSLYILAYPSKYRKLSLLILAMPVTYAFWNHIALAHSYTLSDTYGRFLYMWFAGMSYKLTIEEFVPPVTKENDGWKSRVRAAYKTLFGGRHELTPESAPKHNYSRREFVLRHVWKAVYMFVLQNLWAMFISHYLFVSHPVHGYDKGIFFRRLPESLDAVEMWNRFEVFWYWCIVNLWMYESYHSVFAAIFVGLGIDQPKEWSMAQFQPITEAWSVRRYWGKHWHNYIYISFMGHTKILTRQWLGMRRGTLLTRLVENTMVFALSGVMHTVVRFAQAGFGTEHWAITLWYIGQMVPIIIEDIVQMYWRQKKKELGIPNSRWLLVFERCIGYAWVIGFNMWSIPKYVCTRDALRDANMREKHKNEFQEWERREQLKKEMAEEVMAELKAEL